jgi:hemolysin D
MQSTGAFTKMKRIKFFKKDDSHEFLPIISEIEEEPVNPLGRTMFWIIIGIIFFTTIWLFVGKVDIVVTARGKIIPDGNIKIIQPLDTGVVQKILVKEGDFVKKGQILMEIDPSTTQPELLSLQENLNYLDMESKRLGAVSDGTTLVLPPVPLSNSESLKTQQSLYSSSMSDLKNQLQVKIMELKRVEEQINSALTQKKNYQNLLSLSVDKEKRMNNVIDLIAKDDLEKVQADIGTYRSNVAEADYKLKELSHQRNQTLQETEYVKSNFKTQNLNQLSDRQKQVTQLKSNIQQITYKNQKQKIVSPVDGYINTLLIHTIGGVVTPAEKLLSIVPVDAPLVVKATVSNNDIGFIKEEMQVSIKIDTFDFQKYGIVNGVVDKISKDSIDDPKLGPVYDVYITPLNKSLIIEGKPVLISSGMSLSAEIKVGKRRIIEFFIYPMIKYWNQAITVR